MENQFIPSCGGTRGGRFTIHNVVWWNLENRFTFGTVLRRNPKNGFAASAINRRARLKNKSEEHRKTLTPLKLGMLYPLLGCGHGAVFGSAPPAGGATCVASDTKKNMKSRFSGQISTTGSTSTSVFLGTTFRISAITPASPLIEKSTTLQSSLWCSHCSVARRQQFSCPRGTATLSLKVENVVPGCWICFLSYCCGQVFF